MNKIMRCTLVLLLLTIHVSRATGNLVVLRSKEKRYSGRQHSRKLVCVSEDDGSGLTWNSNLFWHANSYAFSDRDGNINTAFRSLSGYGRSELDCALTVYGACTDSWNPQNWSLTNSLSNPMGPVLDSRWENFREYNNFHGYNEYMKSETVRRTGALVFSVRTSTDAHILLCNSESYESDFCYWVIIGGWGNTRSVIRRCSTGVPHPADYPQKESECGISRALHEHNPLSAFEWRTFVLTWNDETRNISVYDTNKIVLNYVDDGTGPRMPSNVYHVFTRSTVPMLYRYHTYTYLHTVDHTAALISPLLYTSPKVLCVDMLIGLCGACEMEIVVVDGSDENIVEFLELVEGYKVASAHGLPTWQHVRINKSIPIDFSNVAKIKLIPRLAEFIKSPLWAVANVRMCPQKGALRYGEMEATQDYNNSYGAYYWPNVTCQKLFYNENVVIESTPAASLNLPFVDLYCPEGRIGPHCSISCEIDLQNDADCRGSVICEKEGCTCSPGFTGGDCRSICPAERYGHDCNEVCGKCLDQKCNYKTGLCIYGCDNSERFNIPPFCKRGIDPLPPPEVTFVDETRVRATIPVREEYKETLCTYLYFIKSDEDSATRAVKTPKEISKNTTSLDLNLDNLQPGTTYWIHCVLYAGNAYEPIRGAPQNFTTRCNPNMIFELEINQRSLTLKGDHDAGALYSCPIKSYNYALQENSAGVEIKNGILFQVPYEIQELKPDTDYLFIIKNGNEALFSRSVKTLEAEPSKIRNLRYTFSNNWEVTLEWDPPEHPNGKIVRYDVILLIQEYMGCSSSKSVPTKSNNISTSTASNTMIFSDLHPYAYYVAKVAACNKYRGADEQTTFSTDQSTVPTSTLSNLRIKDYNLRWDLPEDCTTISGPIPATRLIIDGCSSGVATFHEVRQTKSQKFNLAGLNQTIYGAEEYKVRIYAIRGYDLPHNENLYQELLFTTPPKAPPPVRNLEIYEVDSQNRKIGLRWRPPNPPLNGKIKQYVILICNQRGYCESFKYVSPTDNCAIWNNYICAIMQLPHFQYTVINVAAVNVNVSARGRDVSVPIVRYETGPGAPENFGFQVLQKGVVNLSWEHPWKTGGHIEKFQILVTMLSSNLRQFPLAQKGFIQEYYLAEYQAKYKEQLHLLSSSTYRISICAVTNSNKYGDKKIVEVQTPLAIAFAKDLTSMVYNVDSTICLQIPAVLNDTKDSRMSVIVKGPRPCERYSELSPGLSLQAGIKNYEIAWRAASFPTYQYAGKTFTVGDNKIYDGAINCPLIPEESYVIVVIVQTEAESINGQIMIAKTTSIRIGKVPEGNNQAWIIPIVIFLLVMLVVIFVIRRRRKRFLKPIILPDEMALAQNSENLERTSATNSKQLLSTPTPSDKESLSRISTPDVPIFVGEVNQKMERTSLVKVKDFEDYVRQAIISGLLDRQYDTFPRGQTKPWEYGKLPQNKSKNRYGNLIAYDETRVVLTKLPDDPYSDYINANYISGYKKEKCYIATQGPKPSTVIDFWRMIWQERTLIICMLSNVIESGKTKCEQYWPDIGKKKKYGDVIVLNAKHNVFADYTFRILQVTCGEETRKIEHLHYTAWPDHGVPLYTHSVVTYLKKLLATPPGNGPVVVHCSAGVGRTGTIVLCDICLHRAAAEGVVDVFAETEMIRNQRANMVDNKQQYLLAHLALVECLLSFPTALPCNEVLPIRIKELKKLLGTQQQRLQDTAWQDEALRPMMSRTKLSEKNLAKNRYPDLVSEKINRIYLKRYPPSDEDSDYVSAVYVDGVKQQNQFLATQLPMPSTFNDFWRMIAELKVELLVMLQPPDPNDITCCPITPTCTEFKPTPYINVTKKEFVELECYTSQKLTLIDNSEKPAKERQVTILCLTDWKPGKNQSPPAVMTLVTMWQAAERISRGEGPTVVLCHDGVTGCGLYLALSFLLERMSVERECDVCLAIRAVRRSRPDFVRSLEQMEYLYDSAITYLEYFETYANFT